MTPYDVLFCKIYKVYSIFARGFRIESLLICSTCRKFAQFCVRFVFVSDALPSTRENRTTADGEVGGGGGLAIVLLSPRFPGDADARECGYIHGIVLQ